MFSNRLPFKGGFDMKDYEYYYDEMNKGTIANIESSSAMEEKLIIGRILLWLPRKIWKLITKK